jgi:hypothetical protein
MMNLQKILGAKGFRRFERNLVSNQINDEYKNSLDRLVKKSDTKRIRKI